MASSSPYDNATDGAAESAISPLLDVENLRVSYQVRDNHGKRAELSAVAGMTFHINAGETVGLVGESGCGKSTLGRAIVGVEPIAEGDIRIDGVTIRDIPRKKQLEYRRRIQLIFQNPQGSLNPRWTIRQSISEPLIVHSKGSSEERDLVVNDLLERVGLPSSIALRYPHQLSGGQQQRVAIARALAVEPDLIVCDEPVSALDVSVQAQVTDLLSSLQDEVGIAYLFITHDLAVVRSIADRVAVMYLGRTVEAGESETIFSAPRHPYTLSLLSASPIPNAAVERKRNRIILKGDVPNPLEPPSGCRFRTRCLWAQKRCAEEIPELRSHHGRAIACHFPEEAEEAAGQYLPWTS